MQQTFGMSLLALVNGEPVTLTLKRILRLFIEHRQEIIRRRSQFDLAKARARSHIVEGLLKALDILDEVIQTIRRSQRVDTRPHQLDTRLRIHRSTGTGHPRYAAETADRA